ncbi:MAG: hypothetical protein SGARI_006223 [Bacillariaceae sp.]
MEENNDENVMAQGQQQPDQPAADAEEREEDRNVAHDEQGQDGYETEEEYADFMEELDTLMAQFDVDLEARTLPDQNVLFNANDTRELVQDLAGLCQNVHQYLKDKLTTERQQSKDKDTTIQSLHDQVLQLQLALAREVNA